MHARTVVLHGISANGGASSLCSCDDVHAIRKAGSIAHNEKSFSNVPRVLLRINQQVTSDVNFQFEKLSPGLISLIVRLLPIGDLQTSQ